MNFASIRLEGSILTADVLDAIAREEKHFQKPSDFGLDPSTKVKDEIASTWASAKALWTGYHSRITKLREGQTGVSETRNLFVLPLLSLLGYQPEKTEAETVNAKSYAISHRDVSRDGFPLHIMGWHDSLDKKRVSGGPRISSHALVQEYLNLTEHLYGLITNGRLLRLLRDSSRLIKLSFLEFDLMRIFEEDLYADFAILFRLLHASRMPANRVSASGSVIEKYHQDSVDSGSRIRDGLAAAVAYSMQTVANGLLAHPANADLVDGLRDNPALADELHQDLLRWVYRTLFLLVIEERVLNHAPEATLRQRRFYRDFYSLQRLRRLADRPQLADRRAHDLWRSMHQTLRLYEAGGKGLPLGVAPLGSFLFREEGLRNLFQYQLDNRSFLQALNRLSTFTHPDTKVRVRVNYGALDVEEFGSVYESLLELRPRIIPDGEKLTFNYAHLTGNERKTTGSYYTPDSLVQCLLDSALDPVVDERLKGKTGGEAEKALLSIKVCDPAVGSGHFLIGAAHRLAQRLADIRAGEEALSPDVQRHALRDVVNRCLYGVDVNPLSGELCKVSLWMLAMEPGKPLGFLDHHIQCGNSLLGVTPRLLNEGIPDDAFKPIAGDDKKYCSDFKKENKKEARDVHKQRQGILFDREDRPWEHLGNLAAHLAQLSDLPDETPEQIHAKEQRYAELVHSSSYKSGHLLADAWCAAFVWKKCKPADGGFDYPITNDIFWKLERNPHSIPSWMRDEIHRLREEYQFFHWQLAFPDVFPLPGKGEQPENKDAGWKGGFDVILGNPPWDKIQPEEEKFFEVLRPDITEASSAKVRKALIEALPTDDPPTYRVWDQYKRHIDAMCHFLRSSGTLRFTGDGNLNSYRIFTELCATFIGARGRAGLVAQTGVATDESGKELFDYLLSSGRLCRFLDFENRGEFFADVHQQFRFCLITVRGGTANGANPSAEFGWLLHRLDELGEPGRLVRLNADDLLLFNPSSRTSPVFTSTKDVEVSRHIYSHGEHVMLDEERRIGRIDFLGELFNMTRDSGLFLKEAPEESFPLYEAKFIHQFDHRFAEYLRGNVADLPGLAKGDAGHAITPKSFVDARIVRERLSKRSIGTRWLCGFRDIASATNERTAIVAVFPLSAVGNSINMVLGLSAADAACFVANANSFSFDYCCRQKLSGTHVNIWIFKQLPAISLNAYSQPCAWAGRPTAPLRDWLLPRVLELTYTAWDLEPFARDCGWTGPPFVWDELRRFQLRCELDAAYFHLYGLSRADSAYILDTFPIVRRKDEATHGTYRTRDTILALYDAFAEAMQPNRQPFVSPLKPAPATLGASHRWSWRELPMKLPSRHREPLPFAYQYVVTVMTELILQSGGSMPWAALRTATDLLGDRKKLARLAEPEFDQVARDWFALKGDRFDPTHRFDQLSGMCFAGRMRVVSEDAELVVELMNLDEHADFPHVRFDARLALAVANRLAVEAPDAAAMHEEKRVASLVPA